MVELENTEFVEVVNDYHEGYYEEGYEDDPYSGGTIAGFGKIVTEVTGDLAERILARAELKTGKVTIIEDHWDSGYCVTCSNEEIDFEVQVDGVEVWTTRPFYVGTYGTTAETLNNLGEFDAWLKGGPANAAPVYE